MFLSRVDFPFFAGHHSTAHSVPRFFIFLRARLCWLSLSCSTIGFFLVCLFARAAFFVFVDFFFIHHVLIFLGVVFDSELWCNILLKEKTVSLQQIKQQKKTNEKNQRARLLFQVWSNLRGANQLRKLDGPTRCAKSERSATKAHSRRRRSTNSSRYPYVAYLGGK